MLRRWACAVNEATCFFCSHRPSCRALEPRFQSEAGYAHAQFKNDNNTGETMLSASTTKLSAMAALAMTQLGGAGDQVTINVSSEAGHYNQWELVIPETQTSNTGTMEFVSANYSSYWLPTFTLFISNQADGDNFVGARCTAGEDETFGCGLVCEIGEDFVEKGIEQRFTLDEVLAYEISWSEQEYSLQINDLDPVSITCPIEPNIVAPGASSGSARFKFFSTPAWNGESE